MANEKDIMDGRIKALLEEAIGKKKNVIMVELPAEGYYDSSAESIRTMLKMGFDGVYVSFQRPFKSVCSFMDSLGIDTRRMKFVDVASSLAEEKQEKDARCTITATNEIDDIVRAVYTSLNGLSSPRKFVFIDSLTTIALYKPLSETMRLSEFLVRTVRKDNGILIFNVAKDLSQKKFIRDIALKADEVIGVAE